MTTTDRIINPAFASSLSVSSNHDCKRFMDEQLSLYVKGSDEWVIKLDSLSHLGELSTRELFDHMTKVNKDKPQDAYRARLASLGLWPKSLKGDVLKPVNEKECASRKGQYATRAKVFECLRKMAKKAKDATELEKADALAVAQGFSSAADMAEKQAASAAVTPAGDCPVPLPINGDLAGIIAQGTNNKDLVKSLLQSIVDNAGNMTADALQDIAKQAIALVDAL